MQRMAGNAAVSNLLGRPSAGPVVQRDADEDDYDDGHDEIAQGLRAQRDATPRFDQSPLVVARLATSPTSLGNTGAVGQVKGLFGQSTYLQIKDELRRYYKATTDPERKQSMQKMLVLIDQWMKSNGESKTAGNLSRMAKLKSLESEIKSEMIGPPPNKPLPAIPGQAPLGAPPNKPLPPIPGQAPLGAPPNKPLPPIPGQDLDSRWNMDDLNGGHDLDSRWNMDELKSDQDSPLDAPPNKPLPPIPGDEVKGREDFSSPDSQSRVPIDDPVPEGGLHPQQVPPAQETAGIDATGMPPEAVQLADQLGQIKGRVDATHEAEEKVALIKHAKELLDQLLPLLSDPKLGKIRAAITDYTKALTDALPGLEEQAEYMKDVKSGPEKLAYFSPKGLTAVSSAVKLAAAATNPAAAAQLGGHGAGPEALQLMKERKLTDAEVAAIKIYTADDYRVMNAGSAKNRGGWLQSAISNTLTTREGMTRYEEDKYGFMVPKGIDNRIMGDELKPGEQGPLSPADTAASEGRRHGKMLEGALAKLEPWKGPVFRGLVLTEEELQEQYRSKTTWESHAFTSTSRIRSVSENFIRYEGRNNPNKVQVLISLTVTNGRDISAVSQHGTDEGEVLLLPGAKADIVSVTTDPAIRNRVLIEMNQTQ